MKLLSLVVAIAVFAVGCGRDINNKDAVRKGVVEYLNKRSGQTGLDLNNMNLEVTSVSFQKNEAHATVSFKPKGTEASSGMSMNYVLERQGDQWVVKGRQESGLNPHGGNPGMTAPGMGGTQAAPVQPGAAGQMPPNHPPVGGAKPEKK